MFVIVTTATWSCKEDDSLYYKGESYIQFSQMADDMTSYTFIYSSDDVMNATVELNIDLLGYLSPEIRYFEITQIEHIEWEYIYDDYGNMEDRIKLDRKQAVPGVHYKPISKEELRVDPKATNMTIPLTVLRDASLQENDYYLRLRLVASDDLQLGYERKLEHVIKITDKLMRPRTWGTAITNYFLGEYSVTKHRMMIEVTQMVWEDDVIIALMEDDAMADYYIGIFKQELARREQEAGGPIKDENNKIITFPR